MDVWRERSLRATVVLLVSSCFLIGPSLVGIGSSIVFLGALLALAGGLVAVRSRLSRLPTVIGHDLSTYGVDLWLGPAVAVVLVAAVKPGASPAELQALGGIAGLVGMVNYFVRPIYLGVLGYLRSFLSESESRHSSL